MGGMTGGKGSAPQAPQAPDYSALAQQQAGLNNQSAMNNWMMTNGVSQYTPWGSKGLVADPNSPTGMGQVTSLNPADQQRLDQQRQLQMGGQSVLGNIMGSWGAGGSTVPNYSNANAGAYGGGFAQGGGGNAPISGGGTYGGAGDPARKNTTAGQRAVNVPTLGDPEGTGDVSKYVSPYMQAGFQGVDFSNLGQPVQNVDAGAMQMGLQDPNAVRDQATQAAYKNWSDVNEPLYGRQQEAMRTRIANMGGVSTSEGARQQMSDLLQGQDLSRNEAMNQATLTGGNQAAQNMGMLNTAGQFANQAQAQQFGQGQANANLYNQGINQLMSMFTGQAGFNNAAVQQNVANALKQKEINASTAGAEASASAAMHGQNLAAQTAANQLELAKAQFLYGMGNVEQPTFGNTGGFNSQAPNMYGAGQDQYAAANQAYQGQMANYNNQQSGMGSLLGTGMMAAATFA